MLILYDSNKANKYPLINYNDYYVESILKTGDRNLHFSIPMNEKYTQAINEQCCIENEEDIFVIKSISSTNDNKQVTAQLDLEELEGKEWEKFESVEQTISDCMKLAIAGTGWTIGTCNITKKRTIRKTICSALDIISQCRKTYRAEIEYKTKDKKINIYQHRGLDKGSFLMDTLNLKKLDVQGNTYDFYTRLVALGAIDSNGKNIRCVVTNNKYSSKVKSTIWKDERYTSLESLKEDAQAKLDEMAKPYKSYRAIPYPIPNCSIGDAITIISKEQNVNEKLRVVSIRNYPEECGKDSIEVANSILSFIDIQQEFQESTNTVANITSDNGTVSPSAVKGAFESFNNINVQEINAIRANIGQLKVNEVVADELHAHEANIDKLSANKADIIQLNAVSAKVNVLEADTASIKTLVAGNITAENIQSGFLQTLKGWMLEGSIGNAQISDLNANKIRSGTVDTSLVTVASKDGSITLTGNQLMVNDTTVPTTPKNRVVLGKYQKTDGTEAYGLLVRAEDGQTVMLDGYGVHNAGLTSDAIKDNVVADDANISGNKLDINSVIRSVNGSTEKIESTVVNVGNKTLNVLLQEQTNDITEHGKSLSTHESRITANEKSINLKVDSQTYSQDKTTINKSIETTLTNSKAYADSKKNEAISAASTDATTKANNAKDTAISDSKAYVNQEITTVNSNLSKATSEISVLKGQISLKVEQGDIDKTVTTVKNELDSKITDVITTTETKISDAKSEIKAETDKIKLSVSGLDSTTKAIETQMNDKATKSEIKVVSDKAASIEANLGSITQRVSSTESKVNKVESTANSANDKIDNLEVGGRNLLLDSDEIFKVTHTSFDADVVSKEHKFSPYLLNNLNLLKNKYVTMSVDVKTTNYEHNNDMPWLMLCWYITSNQNMDMGYDITLPRNSDGFIRYSKTQFIKDEPIDEMLLTTDVYGITGTVELRNFKLEIGNKSTDWSQAPEDINKAISDVNETVINKFSEIKATTEGITQRVSSVEDTTNKINGKVANQEQRLQTAEQKITNEAIINTVKKAQTDGKATFATTSSVEQLSDQVNFRFDEVGSPNLLRNTYFENFDTSGWIIGDCTKYFSNPEVFTPTQGWVAFNMNNGVSRCLVYQFLTGRDMLERNTVYTLSLSSVTEGNIQKMNIYIKYMKNGQSVQAQAYNLKLGKNYTRYSKTFTSGDCDFDQVQVFFDVYRVPGTSGYTVFSIGMPCLSKGTNTAYTSRQNEVYTGNTRVSRDGVTIYNGALTVVNKSGQNVISADSNGDISFRGKLQPNDYQVKLFGNNCQIDGSAGAVRMQLTPQIYMAMDSAGYMRIYNQRSSGGTNYVSLGVNEEGHTILFCGRTMLKLLGGSQPGVQARWGGDGGYAPMQASDFINNSTIKAKTNISSLNIENAINIIKENNIRTYQLKSDIDNDGLDHEKTLWDSNAPIKTGLIIEELTPQAKDMLVPKDTDCISLYSMVSLLWGVVQEQQKQIETQQKQIDELKSLVIKD